MMKMNLTNKLNNEQIKLLKEAGIVIQNKDYTEDECRYVIAQVMTHIMSFSKKDIGCVANKYGEVIEKIKRIK